MFDYVAATQKGCFRGKNEDRIMVGNELISEGSIAGGKFETLLAVVCDGVGGTLGGEKAAEIVAGSFMNFEPSAASPRSVSSHLYKTNRWVITEQANSREFNGMASTVAGIVLSSDRYMVFNLGDTRVYKICSNGMELLSRDHLRQAETCPIPESGNDRFITSYIGGDGRACFPTIKKGNAEKGDIFFLCSDGVYKFISEVQLKDILASKNSLEQKKRAILNLSLQNGSRDDLSIILIKKTD